MAQSKREKTTAARKNAEAQKALKKQARMTKGTIASTSGKGKKGPSMINQSKTKKK